MRRASASLSCVALTLACVSSRIESPGKPVGATRSGEAVTVLLNAYQTGEGEGKLAASSAEAAKIEEQLAECLEDALDARAAAPRVIAPAEFARQVFPGVPPERVPRSPEPFFDLARDPEFRTRTQALGLRYIAIATGATQMPSTGGGVCFGGFGAGACVALVIWHRDSQLAALVFDLESGTSTPGPSVAASSHAWFAMLGILPLGMPAGFTKAEACRQFGSAVAAALAPGSPAPE